MSNIDHKSAGNKTGVCLTPHVDLMEHNFTNIV